MPSLSPEGRLARKRANEKARRARWTQVDRELHNARCAEWRQRNREKVKLMQRRWLENNRGKARASARAWEHRNPEKVAAKGRRRKYGITEAEYALLLAKQEGRCAGCSDIMPRPHVDHDHDTGAVRGLLCSGCNKALGYVRDDSDTLRCLAAYLERADADQ